MPQTRKYANSRFQARRPNNQTQRRQQSNQQNQQPSNNQHPRQSRVIEPGDHKPNSRQSNNGPITRASSNKHVKSESTRDEPNVRQEQQAASVLIDDREKNLAALHKDMEEILDSDVYCAICREVYVNPIILNCSHSFCKFCLTHWLNKQVCCPSCRMAAVFQTENLALRNTISKMITSTSAKYKKERENLVKVRLEAETKAQVEGLIPLMEKKEAELAANDLGFRTRNNGRRRRVIGQWKGPNGATIWRTSVVGDKVISHNPEETSDPSEESGDENILEIEDLGPPIHFQAERALARMRARRAIQLEEYSDEERQRNAADIISLYNGDFRDDDSDSNDSEFVAPEMTTSDEEFEHRMSEIESLDEDLSSEETDSNSDTSSPSDSGDSHSDDDSDSTETEISGPADVSYEQSDHDEIEEDQDSDEQSVIVIDENDSDGGNRYARDDSSDSMDWNDDSDGESVRANQASPDWSLDHRGDSSWDDFHLHCGVRVTVRGNDYPSESDDSY